MTDGWRVLLVGLAVLAVVWLVLVAALYVMGRRYDDPARLRDAIRVVPDVVRLLRRLASDRSLPRGLRARIVLVAVYLALPVDLVPDVIPVVGYADDVIVVALLLRSVARRAGPDVLERHWPGTPEGLRMVERLAGLGR